MTGLWERLRTRSLHSDVFHPKRHWYTLLATAFVVACVGGLVGFLEYRRVQHVFVIDDGYVEVPTQVTEDDLSAVFQVYRTRSDSFSAVREMRGEVVYPSDIPQAPIPEVSEDVSTVDHDDVLEDVAEPSTEEQVTVSP